MADFNVNKFFTQPIDHKNMNVADQRKFDKANEACAVAMFGWNPNAAQNSGFIG